MPWTVSNLMNERVRSIGRLLEGEKMAALCRGFGISRKTGYKIFNRYKDSGLDGLKDQPRTPYRHGMKLPYQVERVILGLKNEYPHWGAPKIREKLRRQYPQIKLPAISTVHAVLARNGLVNSKRKRRYKANGTDLTDPRHANQLWCADCKGEFLMGNKQYCYPLTITDYSSRYLLACEALDSTGYQDAFTVFKRVFKEFSLPYAIRTDRSPLLEPLTI